MLDDNDFSRTDSNVTVTDKNDMIAPKHKWNPSISHSWLTLSPRFGYECESTLYNVSEVSQKYACRQLKETPSNQTDALTTPPRHDLGRLLIHVARAYPAGCHVNTERSNRVQLLSKMPSIQLISRLFGILKTQSQVRGGVSKTPFPPPAFDSCKLTCIILTIKPPANRPVLGPCLQPGLERAPLIPTPVGLEPLSRPGFGLHEDLASMFLRNHSNK